MAEGIAIVGSACRFPGSSTSPSRLWDLLKNPRDVLQEIPSDRFNLSNFYSQDGSHPGLTDVKNNQSYVLSEDCRTFDAGFFRINNKEAHGMDPQQRNLLETVFEATEAAGWTLEQIKGTSTGVYVGAMTADFNDIQMRDPAALHPYAATGTARSMLANRISYFFDLLGPSVTIDTACSSSMVALHQAVQGLRAGDADSAVVAGSALLLDPCMFIAESKLHMLSPDARSRMWDEGANGYARGEGFAAILLKPLSKAIRDSDDIECIIRGTGVGSDGRTNGITMPSAEAQTRLIRRTYEAAGLDPVQDRCQYFECHGTGTLAGDPIEAEAIQATFFPDGKKGDADGTRAGSSPLFCGSIKTVIGHLEGCAGLAGILKASLAIKHGIIPPNMHFKRLHPAVEPFYDGLCVPTSPCPWPSTEGRLRRASVNSFGFGGTNAHTILESAPPQAKFEVPSSDQHQKLVGPFVFSAKTSRSLIGSLTNMTEHIERNPNMDLDSLSWVLHTRRSRLPFRIAVAASDRAGLLRALHNQVSMAAAAPQGQFGVHSPTLDSRQRLNILGVFTGQGAQQARMGCGLLRHCPLFRASMEESEKALHELADGPSWSLMAEATKGSEDSRVDRAEISQPLCTALQIALVDLLRASGVQFDTVVGHSSGEIAAAYAAGILTARDAMGIAYHRGVVAQNLLTGSSGQPPGAMMAVGMSLEDATAFCSHPKFANNLQVAASNAAESVTLSGDMNAIHEAKAILDQENRFARLLKVDVAYHSHHMTKCAENYKDRLQALDIRPQSPRHGCVWYSSVDGYAGPAQICSEQLKGIYWVENMVRPVMFKRSIESIITQSDHLCAVLEAGPHPTLKTPVSQTLRALGHPEIPYIGVLNRKMCDVESLSTAIGTIWSHVETPTIDFKGWRCAFGRPSRPRVLKGLPSYAWDHTNVYWHEPRLSRQLRLETHRHHKLLGHVYRDWATEMEWRNVFRQTDLPWLRGHTFQGQVVFPAAGYISMAVDAALVFARGRPVKLLEALEVNIDKALAFADTDESVETLFTVRNRSHSPSMSSDPVLEVDFACQSCIDGSSMTRNCDGRLRIHLGESTGAGCPQSPICEDELPPLDTERFFASLQCLGLAYDGHFRAIKSMKRIWGVAQASAAWVHGDLEEDFSLHPATLDVAFQTGLSTFISIADNAMASACLPSRIRHLIIDPNQHYRGSFHGVQIGIDACLVEHTSSAVEVDIHVYDGASRKSGIRVDGLVLKAVAEPQACDDRRLFAKTVWEQDVSLGFPHPPQLEASGDDTERVEAAERTALYYLHRLEDEISNDDYSTLKWHHQSLLRSIKVLMDNVRQGHHPVLKTEWLDDSHDLVRGITTRFSDCAEISLLKAVGENLPSVVRGKSEMLEHMLGDNLLGRLYSEGRGFDVCNKHIANFMRSISHKYPQINILEVGAGTGATTHAVLDAINDAYASYTYTDISSGFFETAASNFDEHGHKIRYKTLNVETDPSKQGFLPGSYDVIIAANVLHATRRLAQTVQHIRSLLRPGGFLVAVEVTGSMLRETGLMGGLEGWWLGADDGRFPTPGISLAAWDQLLSENGFSGICSYSHDFPDISKHNCSAFVAQATDGLLNLLADPLSANPCPELTAEIFIIGGKTLAIARAVRKLKSLLQRWTSNITISPSIDALDPSNVKPGANVVSLTELDEAIFAGSLNARKLDHLQRVIGNSGNVLWVTSGGLIDNPHADMMAGVGRALVHELPHVRMQFLSFDQSSSLNMEIVAQSVLRMVILRLSEYQDSVRDCLWLHEPEIQVRGDTIFVPRVVSDDETNERLNATRRRITELVDKHESIEVSYTSSTPSLVKSVSRVCPQNAVQIDIELSLAIQSARADASSRFLCFGRQLETNRSALVLSDTNSSTVFLQNDQVFYLPTNETCDAKALLAAEANLVALHVLSNSPGRGTILLHEPTEYVAEAITTAVARKRCGVRVLFVTAEPRANRSEWISVNPLARTQDFRAQIPKDVFALWKFSDYNVDNILTLLPEGYTPRLCEPHAISGQPEDIAAVFESAQSTGIGESPSTIDICEYSTHKKSPTRVSEILNWQRNYPVRVVIAPGHTSYQFAGNKTYFLVGLTGELGQSLCRFMVRSGARHIVIASRNACRDSKWLQSLGVNIRAVKMDVTNRQQVRETVAMIRESMPEIAGVANASLTLVDSLFINTSLENVKQQLEAKVNGTKYLHEEFSQQELDFYILFSSLGTVYGSPGQSIYHAANMFMTAFAAQRRRRGQAASVIDVGMISDVGYVAKSQRAGTNLEQHLRCKFYTPLSETDFHHLFVQAISAGHPISGSGQLTMGIEPFEDVPGAHKRPMWYDNPRFSHMIKASSPGSSKPSLQSSTVHDLRKRLGDASSAAEMETIFQELFCKRLESLLQIPAGSVDVIARLSELGLDSLLAVEIRSWLLKEASVEVPLFGILGHESVSSIVSKAVQGSAGAGSDAGPADQSTAESQAPSQPNWKPEHVSPAPVIHPPVRHTPEASQSCTSKTVLNNSEFQYTRQYIDEGPASYSQAALHFLQHFLDDATTFNITAHYEIRGNLNVGRFSQALQRTLARHETYRTCFLTEPGSSELRQAVAKTAHDDIFTHLHSTANSASKIFQELSMQTWDLGRGRTFRAILVSHAQNSHSLVLGCHHIIMDGLSWHIFLRDLNHAYQMAPLAAPEYSALDFARRQIKARDDGSWEEATKYWMRHWMDPKPSILPLLPLSRTSHRLPRRAYRNHIVERHLDPSLTKLLGNASRHCAVTPMQFHLAVVQTLLARLTHHEDICIGVATTGRGDNQASVHTSDVIGHFTNLLPMRFRVAWEAPFAELLRRTFQTVLAGLVHAHVPFDHLLDRIGIQRSEEHTPLFQVAFNYRVGDLLQQELGDCTVKLVHYEDAKTPYDLTFNVTQTPTGGQLVEIASDANLYSEKSTETIMDIYIGLLRSLTLDQSVKVKDCLPYQCGEGTEATMLGRGPEVQHQWPETLTERFQEVCATFPDAVAVRDEEKSVTYSQLAKQVDAIAAEILRSISTSRGARIAVLCEPSLDMYAALLGILHVGAIYTPLDLSLPASRRHAILDVSKPVLLIHQKSTAITAQQHESDVPVLLNVSDLAQAGLHNTTAPQVEDEAFLLFTSGSTGIPKGIRLTQSGIMNYAASKQAALGLGPGIKVLQQSSLGFDASLSQVVNAFANAGTLSTVPMQSRGDPVAITDLMVRESVNMTICTPSEYLMLLAHATDTLRQCKDWKYACSGGEAVTDGLVSGFRELGLSSLSLTDCYGPTETSAAVTFRSVPLDTDHSPEISVGKSISNMTVYTVDENGQLMPAGFVGEICLSGRGVARGYLDQDATAARFVRDPFLPVTDACKERSGVMYKTGDKGCLRADGSLVFLGRLEGDTQVKLRGMRIELDEVAGAVVRAARGDLVDAVVTVRGQPGSEFLVAHVVPAQGACPTKARLDEIRAALPLPQYMTPSVIFPVAHVPMTSNGKVDRKAASKLNLPVRSHEIEDDGDQSLTVAEGELRLLWADVLGEAAGAVRIVADTDFFMVGGTSLLLVRLQGALKEKMGVCLALHELYHCSTLRSMAAAADKERGRVVPGTIDWTMETTISDEFLNQISGEAADPKPRTTHRQILLTGAAGHLGSEMLAVLLEDESVSKVHCVALPRNLQDTIASNEKVVVYSGSLTSPTLGLSSDDISTLGPLIDQIIHAGAQGHCLNNYTSVRSANYLSTQFLARLAAPRRIPLHFVSSPRVTLLRPGTVEAPPASMAAHQPPADGSQGFTASKWASEVFLEAMARRIRDFPVVVHRPCSLVGPRASADDALNAVVRFSCLSRCVPDVPGTVGYFDFRDVTEVATEIVRGALAPPGEVGCVGSEVEGAVSKEQVCCSLTFRHYSSGVRVPFGQLASRMEELYGGKFETVLLDEWIRRAVRLGIQSVIVSYLEANVAGAERLTFPFMGAGLE